MQINAQNKGGVATGLVYPRLKDCPAIPENEDIYSSLAMTEREYTLKQLGFSPKNPIR